MKDFHVKDVAREWLYSKGNNTKKDFCKWLLLDQHSNFTVIAHNF